MRRSGLIIGGILALTCAGVSHNIHAGMARSLVQAGRLSGHWHIRYTWRCANTPRNLLACAALNGGHEIAIMGLRRTTIAHQETDDFVSDSRGIFSGHGQEIVTEKMPRASKRCDQTALPFNGTCRYALRERGFIARGKTGRPDFFLRYSATIVLTGHSKNPPGHVGGMASPPFDTGFPATPGHLDTRRYLALLGFKTVPSGVRVSYVLTHR